MPSVEQPYREETPGPGPTAGAATATGAATAAGPDTGDGGDACPGALRLHSADDGALARVRLPGGVLTTAQADRLGAAAVRLGDGDLHLTSRGNVQLRGLAEGCGTELAAVLDAAGLLPSPAHERVRNVVASPLSGLDGRGHRPVGPWLRELDALLCADADTPALSGRFLFAVDDGRGDTAALEPDVTLLAGPGDTATVLIGTGAGRAALTVPAADGPRTAVLAARAFLAAARTARASGADRVWRITDLPGGPDAVRRALTAVAGQAPATVTDHDLTAVAGRAPAASVHHAPTTAAGPAVTPVPGPPAPGALPGGVSVLVPLGRLTPSQWAALLRAAERSGGELRLTPWRGVVLPGAAPAELAELAAVGLVTGPGSAWDGVTACVGRPGCAKSLSDVRADATTVHTAPHGSTSAQAAPRTTTTDTDTTDTDTDTDHTTSRGTTTAHTPDTAAPAQDVQGAGARSQGTGVHLQAAGVQGAGPALPVHWSGCARRCGRPRGHRVDVVATPTGYEVTTAGDAGARDGVRPGDGAARGTSVTDPATLATTVAAARTAR
ncbi:cobalamin biosynthesis protein CobG [Streptomyces sp. JNUCC 64]